MGITNPVHLAFVAIIALIVLGPKRLPDLARSLGEGMRSFRESLEGAATPDHDEMLNAAMSQPESPQAPVEHAPEATMGFAAEASAAPAFGGASGAAHGAAAPAPPATEHQAAPAVPVGAPPYPHAPGPAAVAPPAGSPPGDAAGG